ncbi:hypothetical protein RFI_26815 [Reticulomyxa filosa]|uniref:Uncharacterized protein n=1 Tax=Reticulomyxa filosa TaxID=46433 RepID=X6MBY2_RETFI|nr:hypothetical protein RFI_26815 [Reticulomyxa filosa]|eukprot:ETO10560.1 hypothetical protein RFI_26815 [Reticulomyxa filosa]
MTEPVYSVKAHENVVNYIAGCGSLTQSNESSGCGASELVTCSRDGSVKVWDPRTSTSVCELVCAKKANGNSANKRDCWTVAFGNSFDNSNRVVCAGYDNGDIKMLDLKMNAMIYEYNLNNGIVDIEFDRTHVPMNKMVVTTLESKFFVFDLKTMHSVDGFAYSTQPVLAFSILLWLQKTSLHKKSVYTYNRDIWCTTGGNGTVQLWKYSYPSQRSIIDKETNTKKGVMGEIVPLTDAHKCSDQPLISWHWNKDKIGLACATSLDQKVRVFFVTKLHKI